MVLPQSIDFAVFGRRSGLTGARFLTIKYSVWMMTVYLPSHCVFFCFLCSLSCSLSSFPFTFALRCLVLAFILLSLSFSFRFFAVWLLACFLTCLPFSCCFRWCNLHLVHLIRVFCVSFLHLLIVSHFCGFTCRWCNLHSVR